MRGNRTNYGMAANMKPYTLRLTLIEVMRLTQLTPQCPNGTTVQDRIRTLLAGPVDKEQTIERLLSTSL